MSLNILKTTDFQHNDNLHTTRRENKIVVVKWTDRHHPPITAGPGFEERSDRQKRLAREESLLERTRGRP